MDIDNKWNILFIAKDKSLFDSNTQALNQFFNKVDKTSDTKETLKLLDSNQYDIIISDISVEAMDGIIFLKEIKEKKPHQSIFALVSHKDTDKLYLIADLGINAFELTPMDFDLALEEIARFDPYAQEDQ
jgi:DNA-binding NtrC family response regulator